MRETAFDALLRSTVFNALSPKGLRILKKEIRTLHIKKGRTLYHENTPADAFYFILKGRIHTILKSSQAKNKKIHTYEEKHFLGETSLFTGLPHHFSAVADEDSELVEISYATFKKLSMVDPALHWNFSRHLGSKLAQLEKKLGDSRKHCKLIAIFGKDLKKNSWFAMELALSLKDQFKKEVLLVDLNVQQKSIDELLNLKIPNHYLVIHLPAKDHVLQELVSRYADFVFHSKGVQHTFETSAKSIELNLSKDSAKLQWQVGHYARVIAGKTVGVALSSGTALAVAHYGVLRELVKNNIPIDYIAGTSGGAIFGALFSLGFEYNQVVRLLRRTNKVFIALRVITSLAFSRMGLVRFDRVMHKIFPLFKLKNFSDMKYPMVIIGTNLTDGRPVYFKRGSVLEALSVSSSVPFLFDPWVKRDQIHADGCLVEPIPVRALRQMGADLVIAVDVTQKKVNREKIKNLLDIYLQSSNLTNYIMGQSALRNADVVISVSQNGEGYFDYHQVEALFSYGEQAAQEKILEIEKILR